MEGMNWDELRMHTTTRSLAIPKQPYSTEQTGQSVPLSIAGAMPSDMMDNDIDDVRIRWVVARSGSGLDRMPGQGADEVDGGVARRW